MSRFAQFFGVAVIGLLIDIAVAWVLTINGLDIKLAAICGFVTAAGANYLLNQHWTFADSGHRKSATGFARFLAFAFVALAVRLLVLWLMQILLPESLQITPLMLLTAAGLSLIVNFIMVQRFVFHQAPKNGME